VTTGELVLVVPRALVPGQAGWRGVRAASIADILDVIARAGSYRPRAEMEADPTFKQVIPYLVLRDGADYFLMQRTRAGADGRLHDRWSIGIGGHLNPADPSPLDGLVREWTEEIEADFVPDLQFVGLLNDDLTDVGRVHLGIVYVADAGRRSVAIRETDKLIGRFASRTDVAVVADRLESWSRLVFDHLERAAAQGIRSA